MSVPKNITTEHILKAIQKIDNDGVPADATSRYYDVIHNHKRYPPKLVVSYANFYANGEALDRSTFEGGLGTPCFQLLERNGFVIEKKQMNYYRQLLNFLDQSRTSELGTSGYESTYAGLKVKVSFGKGNVARIPWIAFLQAGQSVSDGIYPVYLLYKERNLLILSYGVSETNEPKVNWSTAGLQTIEEYFFQHNLGKPERYGNSYVFKSYDVSKPLDETEINSDLSSIIKIYYRELPDTNNPVIEMLPFKIDSFLAHCQRSNFMINEKFAIRFICSMLAKPFLILTGLSGSGKTKLALEFTSWITENRSQVCIVPVGADWTNREPLLGFPNALEVGRYIAPESGALEIILEASREANLDKPYFLILDEMNLSHVERYFADFLSAMESGQAIALHSDDKSWKDNVPASIRLPSNLFIIGTVNIDETTYMFSPKVLDRANVLEFRVTEDEMAKFLSQRITSSGPRTAGSGSNTAASFLNLAKNRDISVDTATTLNSALLDFFKILKPVGAEFGYRSASEIIDLVAIISSVATSLSMNEIIDIAIVQKLLPKVHGSRRKLEPILRSLASLCVFAKTPPIDPLSTKDVADFSDSTVVKYPIALEKIHRMHRNLIDNGFTSYAEA